MQFMIALVSGQTAAVDLGTSERMKEVVVRPALTDPQVKPQEPGDYLIVFKVKEPGKPFKPDAILVHEIIQMGNNGRGQIALLLSDGKVAYPTVALNDLPKAQALLKSARIAPGNSRRLFFARVDGELQLLETSEIRRSRSSQPPNTRTSSIPPDAG
jgi:hypothetical protein